MLVLVTPFGRIGIFHGTPASENEVCGPEEIKRHLRVFQELDLSHVLVGHTHHSYAITVEGIEIYNLGHLGIEAYGEPFQKYAVIDVSGSIKVHHMD